MVNSICTCDGCKAYERYSQEFPRDNWDNDTKKLAEWVSNKPDWMAFRGYLNLETIEHDLKLWSRNMNLEKADFKAVAQYVMDYNHFNVWPQYYTSCKTHPVPDCHLTK